MTLFSVPSMQGNTSNWMTWTEHCEFSNLEENFSVVSTVIGLKTKFIQKEKLSSIKLEEFYATLKETKSQSIRQRAQKILGPMCEISKARHRS